MAREKIELKVEVSSDGYYVNEEFWERKKIS